MDPHRVSSWLITALSSPKRGFRSYAGASPAIANHRFSPVTVELKEQITSKGLIQPVSVWQLVGDVICLAEKLINPGGGLASVLIPPVFLDSMWC